MSFDSICVAAVAAELRREMLGGRVQKIIQADELTIGIELYAEHRRRWLLISADPNSPRVHLSEERLGRAGDRVSPLLLLLRKHLRPSRLTAIEQPGLERVLRLTFFQPPPTVGDDESQGDRPAADRLAQGRPRLGPSPSFGTSVTLIIEAIGRYSNLVLVESASQAGGAGAGLESETVLDAAKRVSAEVNRYRVVLPKHLYVPPPPQSKFALADLDSSKVAELLRAVPTKTTAAQVLVASYAGVSPQLAREAAYRAAGRAAQPAGEADADRLTDSLRDLLLPLMTGDWRPSVAVERRAKSDLADATRAGEASPAAPKSGESLGAEQSKTGSEADDPAEVPIRGPAEPETDSQDVTGIALPPGQIVAFAPYELTQFSATAGLSVVPVGSISRAIDLFFAQSGRFRPVDQAREAALKSLAPKRESARRKIDSLNLALAGGYRAESLRRSGEAILGALADIRRGQSLLVVEGLEVALNPALSAVENSQVYFRRYKKSKAALAGVPTLLAETRLFADFLEQAAAHLAQAETVDDVRAVRSELAGASRVAGRSGRASVKQHDASTGRPEGGAAVSGRGRNTSRGGGRGAGGRGAGGRDSRGSRREPPLPPAARYLSTEGVELLVGKSGRQNDAVTFDQARPDDIWLHARGVAGAHVIARVAGGPLSEFSLREAAALAAFNSASRGATTVLVDWTLRRNVHRIREALPGLVSYVGEKTLHVVPEVPAGMRRIDG